MQNIPTSNLLPIEGPKRIFQDELLLLFLRPLIRPPKLTKLIYVFYVTQAVFYIWLAYHLYSIHHPSPSASPTPPPSPSVLPSYLPDTEPSQHLTPSR